MLLFCVVKCSRWWKGYGTFGWDWDKFAWWKTSCLDSFCSCLSHSIPYVELVDCLEFLIHVEFPKSLWCYKSKWLADLFIYCSLYKRWCGYLIWCVIHCVYVIFPLLFTIFKVTLMMPPTLLNLVLLFHEFDHEKTCDKRWIVWVDRCLYFIVLPVVENFNVGAIT